MKRAFFDTLEQAEAEARLRRLFYVIPRFDAARGKWWIPDVTKAPG